MIKKVLFIFFFFFLSCTTATDNKQSELSSEYRPPKYIVPKVYINRCEYDVTLYRHNGLDCLQLESNCKNGYDREVCYPAETYKK